MSDSKKSFKIVGTKMTESTHATAGSSQQLVVKGESTSASADHISIVKDFKMVAHTATLRIRSAAVGNDVGSNQQ